MENCATTCGVGPKACSRIDACDPSCSGSIPCRPFLAIIGDRSPGPPSIPIDLEIEGLAPIEWPRSNSESETDCLDDQRSGPGRPSLTDRPSLMWSGKPKSAHLSIPAAPAAPPSIIGDRRLGPKSIRKPKAWPHANRKPKAWPRSNASIRKSRAQSQSNDGFHARRRAFSTQRTLRPDSNRASARPARLTR